MFTYHVCRSVPTTLAAAARLANTVLHFAQIFVFVCGEDLPKTDLASDSIKCLSMTSAVTNLVSMCAGLVADRVHFLNFQIFVASCFLDTDFYMYCLACESLSVCNSKCSCDVAYHCSAQIDHESFAIADDACNTCSSHTALHQPNFVRSQCDSWPTIPDLTISNERYRLTSTSL